MQRGDLCTLALIYGVSGWLRRWSMHCCVFSVFLHMMVLPSSDWLCCLSTHNSSLFQPFMRDNYCDAVNNRAFCSYDGGDCCQSTVKTKKVSDWLFLVLLLACFPNCGVTTCSLGPHSSRPSPPPPLRSLPSHMLLCLLTLPFGFPLVHSPALAPPIEGYTLLLSDWHINEHVHRHKVGASGTTAGYTVERHLYFTSWNVTKEILLPLVQS